MTHYKLPTWIGRLVPGASTADSRYSQRFSRPGDALREQYGNIDWYRDLDRLSERRNAIPSTRGILCCNDLPFGCSLADLKKRIGEPQERARSVNEFVDMVVVYREKFSGYKVKSEFHFSRGRLFYFNRLFSHLSGDQPQTVIRLLIDKYCPGRKVNFQEDKIIDQDGNEIIVSHNIVLSLEYIAKRSQAFSEIVAPQEPLAPEKQERSDRTFDALFKNL